jgi:hypothetical protein
LHFNFITLWVESIFFHDSTQPYFVSFATVWWVDIFVRRIYFDIFMQSQQYCITKKKLEYRKLGAMSKIFAILIFQFMVCSGSKEVTTIKNVFNLTSGSDYRTQDTLITEMIPGVGKRKAVGRIILIQGDRKIEILDTILDFMCKDISSEILNDSIATITYQFGIGRSSYTRKYEINRHTAIIKNLLETGNGSYQEFRYCYSVFSMHLEAFSDNLFNEYFWNKEDVTTSPNKICFGLKLDYSDTNSVPDINNWEKYIDSLYKHRDHRKILLCSNIKVLEVIESNISFSYKETLISLNNIAWYFEKSGAYEGAVFILENLLETFPNRTVAYLNLGDAYWGLANKEKARNSYATYISKMTLEGKTTKIPTYVLERVKS